MQFPITIGLRRSRFIDLLIVLMAAISLLVIASFPVDPGICAGLMLMATVIGVWSWRQNQPAVWALRLEKDGRIALAGRGQHVFVPAECLPGATVHPWLAVLRLKTRDGAKFLLFLAPDSLGKDDFRRLRVFLRWRADFSGDDGA